MAKRSAGATQARWIHKLRFECLSYIREHYKSRLTIAESMACAAAWTDFVSVETTAELRDLRYDCVLMTLDTKEAISFADALLCASAIFDFAIKGEIKGVYPGDGAVASGANHSAARRTSNRLQ